MASTCGVKVLHMALCPSLALDLCFAYIFNVIIFKKAPGTVPGTVNVLAQVGSDTAEGKKRN